MGERRQAPTSGSPLPEPRSGFWSGRERLVQIIAISALLWGAAYLIWRAGWSAGDTAAPLFVALLAAEAFSWASLSLYAFLAWSVPTTQRPRRLANLQTIDVFVCTYDEPAAVVEPTLIGCRAMVGPHRTYLLDDGRRPEMAEMAARLGAAYVTRADNAHAKAGNINHALTVTDGELIVMLDADHVPLPELLEATVGYFEDDDVALVQTPHDFSNRDSVQHTKVQRHEQTLFYDVIAPGKDRHNAMFWCGSATIVRRKALEEVGGVLTDTVAEDFHTTIAMHARGWETRYHDESLVQGLAPHDLSAFLLQRARWARGNLAVFRTKQNPITCRGLRMKQRLSYFASLFSYFAGVQRLALLAILTVTLATGELPLHATVAALLALWLPWAVLAFVATMALGRGTLGPLDSTRYGLMTMGIFIRGAASIVRRSAGTFKVTPKEGIDEGGWPVLRMLGLLTTGGVVLTAALVARLLDVAGVLSLPTMPDVATVVVVLLGIWELWCIAKVLVPLVRRRQLRTRYRAPVEMLGRVEGTTVRVSLHDLTPAGLSFDAPVEWADGATLRLLTRLPDASGTLHDVSLPLSVRSCLPWSDGETFRVGSSIEELDVPTREHLVEFCDVVLAAERMHGRPTMRPFAEPASEPAPLAAIHWRAS